MCEGREEERGERYRVTPETWLVGMHNLLFVGRPTNSRKESLTNGLCTEHVGMQHPKPIYVYSRERTSVRILDPQMVSSLHI